MFEITSKTSKSIQYFIRGYFITWKKSVYSHEFIKIANRLMTDRVQKQVLPLVDGAIVISAMSSIQL